MFLIYLPDGPAKLMKVNPVSGAGNGVGPGAVVGIVVAENIDIDKCVLLHTFYLFSYLHSITHFQLKINR